MVLGFGAEFLDSTGNPQDAAAAGVLRYVLETRGADIPMPGADTDPASEKRVADRAGHLAIVVGKQSQEDGVVDSSAEADSLGTLVAELQDITHRYYQAAAYFVPSADKNPTGLRGRTQGIGKVRSTEKVTTERAIPPRTIHYTHSAEYEVGSQYNAMRSYTMRLRDGEEAGKYADAKLVLATKDGKIDTVTLRWVDAGDNIRFLSGQDSLLAEYVPLRHTYTRNPNNCGELVFRLTPDDLGLSITYSEMVLFGKKTGIFTSYDFDPSPGQEGHFVEHFKGTDFAPTEVKLMSIAQYKELLAATLALIPTAPASITN